MRTRKTIRKPNGFTIAELMVSVFIIFLLSGIFLAGYRSSGRVARLKMTAQNLSSDIRKAQGFALGLKEFSDIGETPSGGWGIHTSSLDGSNDYYDIYADYDDELFTGVPDYIYQEANEKFERVNFEGGIYIQEIAFFDSLDNRTTYSEANFTFESPGPTVYLCKGDVACVSDDYVLVEIILADRSDDTKRVVINRFGLVDVEDG